MIAGRNLPGQLVASGGTARPCISPASSQVQSGVRCAATSRTKHHISSRIFVGRVPISSRAPDHGGSRKAGRFRALLSFGETVSGWDVRRSPKPHNGYEMDSGRDPRPGRRAASPVARSQAIARRCTRRGAETLELVMGAVANSPQRRRNTSRRSCEEQGRAGGEYPPDDRHPRDYRDPASASGVTGVRGLWAQRLSRTKI